MIAPINYSVPSRHYLIKYEDDIDNYVKEYLTESGFKVVSNKSFRSIWKKTVAQHGDMYNPSTGRMTPAFEQALDSALNKVFSLQPGLDAVLFTDLVEEQLIYSKGSKKSAEWSGVRRKIKIEGIDNDITDEFNWNKLVDGISLVTKLVNRNNDLLLHNKGGIQVAQAVEIHNKTGRFKRRNDLLQNEDEIMEGIQLALHPFVEMKGYPLKEKK